MDLECTRRFALFWPSDLSTLTGRGAVAPWLQNPGLPPGRFSGGWQGQGSTSSGANNEGIKK